MVLMPPSSRYTGSFVVWRYGHDSTDAVRRVDSDEVYDGGYPEGLKR